MKKLRFKHSVCATMLCGAIALSLSACGNASGNVGNKLSNIKDYSTVALSNTQFNINNELNEQVVYDNDKTCHIYDEKNGIYIYATDNGELSINSKSTDSNILSHMDTYFLDDKMGFSQNANSIQNENEKYTKYIFSDLSINKEDKTFYGELSIIDFGGNETFVLVYSDKKDAVDMDYIVRSVEPISDGHILSGNSDGTIKDNSYITYEKYAAAQEELQRIEDEKNKVVEPEKELDTKNIFSNTKKYSGKYYSFLGYYGLDTKTFNGDDGTNSQPFRDCYITNEKDFVLEFDVINLNEFNNYYGGATDRASKQKYIVDTFKTYSNEDLTEQYSDEEIVNMYNIAISNGALEKFLEEYGVNNATLNAKKIVMGEDEWIVTDTINTNDGQGVQFAFTIDNMGNAYMTVCRYSSALSGINESILKTFAFNNETKNVISESQIKMYGEFLNVTSSQEGTEE